MCRKDERPESTRARVGQTIWRNEAWHGRETRWPPAWQVTSLGDLSSPSIVLFDTLQVSASICSHLTAAPCPTCTVSAARCATRTWMHALFEGICSHLAACSAKHTYHSV